MSTNKEFWNIIEPEFPNQQHQTSAQPPTEPSWTPRTGVSQAYQLRDSVHEAAGGWMVVFGGAFFFGVLAYICGIPA